jgi:putative membrane protein insertion efficiency factor
MFSLRFYRWVLSPAKAWLLGAPACCRFTPSCSEYALEAVRLHGALGGGLLAFRRLVRCHPWGGCGHDPVPLKNSEIRNPKAQGRSKAKIRICAADGLRHPEFGVPSALGFQNSEFR